MPYSTLSYHNNNSPGTQDLVKFNIRLSETSATNALGTRVNLSDGRSFRYSQFGASVTNALLCAQDISGSGTGGIDDGAVIVPASAVTTTDGTAGSRFVQFTLASMGINQLAGGYFHTEDDTGEGYTYRIKGNTATGDPATGDIRIEFYDPIEILLSASTDVFICGNLYANLIASVTAVDTIVSGVTTAVQADNDFGWVQTWGPGSVLCTLTPTEGAIMTGDDGTAGSVSEIGGEGTDAVDLIGDPIVGYAMHDGTNGAHLLVYLQIAP